MYKVMLRSRYDDGHMGLVWYVSVGEVSTQGFDSVWDAIVAGLGVLKDCDDKDLFLWDAAMCLSSLYGGSSIRHYKQLMELIGEKCSLH